MPLFLSAEEYRSCSHDVSLVAEKADSFIRQLMHQLESVKAQENHQFHFSSGGEDERLDKMQLMYILEQKDSIIESYRDEINGLKAKGEADKRKPEGLKADADRKHDEMAETEIDLLKQEKLRLLSQVQEICESNLQLREEKTRYIDECQKLCEICESLKSETESLKERLGEKQNELEVCRKDIQTEREYFDELLERSKNVVEEYDHMKYAVQQLQASLRKKDTGKKTSVDVADVQAIMEKKEEDTKYQSLEKTVEILKDELKKERDELKTGRAIWGKKLKIVRDSTVKSLEKTVEILKDELKKEKDEHITEKARWGKMLKTVRDSFENVSLQRVKLSDELMKHKQGLKLLQDDVEKLKQANDSQAEGSSGIQFLSGTLLDDLCTAYYLAVDDFQQATLPVLEESVDFVDSVPYFTKSSLCLDAISAGAPIERNIAVPTKPNVESSRNARKLIAQMAKVEGSSYSTEPSSSDIVETQASLFAPGQPLGQKRRLSEETLAAEVTAEASMKKLKTCKDDEGLAPEVHKGRTVANMEHSPDTELQSVTEKQTDDQPKQKSESDKGVAADKASEAASTYSEKQQSAVESIESEEGRPPLNMVSTTINMSERAKERAALREAGISRGGRGRASRGRGRSSHGQSSSKLS